MESGAVRGSSDVVSVSDSESVSVCVSLLILACKSALFPVVQPFGAK